jgi:mannose-6-phosphate isomerase-like protein (cupin superfamily)
MAQTFDLSTTFVRLGEGGSAQPVKVDAAFWRGSLPGRRDDRMVGAFDFHSSEDLHASMEEMHPLGDEVIFLVAGAIDVVLEEGGAESAVALEAGHATIVPRGAWHRLVMRRPGRLVFINVRTEMQSRLTGPQQEGAMA